MLFLSSGSREVMAKLLIINLHVYMPMRHTSVLDMLYLESFSLSTTTKCCFCLNMLGFQRAVDLFCSRHSS